MATSVSFISYIVPGLYSPYEKVFLVLMDTPPQVSGIVSEVTPLAFPKGKKKLCELCESEAHVQCTKCRVTYYW